MSCEEIKKIAQNREKWPRLISEPSGLQNT